MKYILNGVDVTPVNGLTISLDSDFTGRPSELEIGADRLVFQREAVTIIQDWIGLYGPVHGMPLDIVTSGGVSIQYYLDLMGEVSYRDFEIEVPIKRRGGKDNFFDQADGTSWEYMASKGINFTTVDVPYIIVDKDAVTKALSLGVAIYSMTKELIDQVIAVSETITQIIDAVTPQTGVGVTFSIGQIATLIIKAIVQLAIIALLVVAIIKMAQQFFELIFPNVRNFQACKVKELVTKGCQFLGYSVSSTLLDAISNATILPVPLVKEKASFWDFLENDLNFAYTKGYPTSSDTVPTLGVLLRTLEGQYNAKTKVVNGVVSLERRDYWQSVATAQVLPALNLQDDRQTEYSYNTSDVWRRKYIAYRIDTSDLHTMDFFDPTDAEYFTEPTNIPNDDLVLIKGYDEISIPFALGVRKTGLNWIENLAKEFFDIVDEITNALGSGTNYAGKIEDRIGVLQVSQQFFSVTKYLWTVGGKQTADYVSHIGASAIYNEWHTINEIEVNDYKVIQDAPVRMYADDFVNLINFNYAQIDGLACEILTMKFFEEQSHAIISYKQPNDWANGKTNVLTINS